MNKKLSIGEAIKFNPPESIRKGKIAKKIPMGNLSEFHRKIDGYEIASYSSGPKFRNGDTLVAKITPCLENGKTAFVDILDENEVAFGSSEFIVLRATEHTFPLFIYYFARSPLFRERAISCMEGTSGRKRVNENTLKNFEFNFPNLSTQKSIAKVLSDLDAKIEVNNRINEELESLANTIYDYWFVQFDFPDREGKPYKSSGGKMVYNEEVKRETPEGWEVKKLSDFVNCYDSLRKPLSKQQREDFVGDIPYYGATGIMGFVKEFLFEKDLILLAEDGSVMDENGFPILQYIYGKSWVNNHAHVLEPKNLRSYDFLRLHLSKIHVIKIMTGSIQKKITQENLMKKVFFFPPEEILASFDKKLKPIRQKIKNIEFQNQELSALRDWLLPMLMNGQVRVV